MRADRPVPNVADLPNVGSNASYQNFGGLPVAVDETFNRGPKSPLMAQRHFYLAGLLVG